MKLILKVTLLIGVISCVFSSNCKLITTSALSDVEKTALVKTHNTLRAKVANGQETGAVGGAMPAAANMNLLAWSDELATLAQGWVDKLVTDCAGMEHNPDRNTATFKPAGENIYWGASGNKFGAISDTLNKATQLWYDEVKDFSNSGVSEYAFNTQTGHFTQVVWAKTTHIGCGYVEYSDDKYSYNQYVVCNYGPAGNFLGEAIYVEGTACSKCENSLPCSEAHPGLCGNDPATDPNSSGYLKYYSLMLISLLLLLF